MKETAIGFIGTGNMGSPMAKNLLESGCKLKVYNRTRSKVDPLVEMGAEAVDSPAKVVEPGGMVITMLTDDEAVREVTFGKHGLMEAFGKGNIHISMSTISPDTSREMAPKHRKASAYYVAAPVSGRPEVAAAGRLGIYLSGDKAPKEKVRPILHMLGRNVADCGEDPGAANVAKLAANFMLFSAVEAFAEALAFAEKQKLDRTKVMVALCDNLFDCPVYRGYGQLLADEEYQNAEFKLRLAFKDLRLAIETSESAAAPMRLAESLHNRMLSLIATGKGDWDMSVIGQGVAEEAGLVRG
jgi:3-hydroxyisobutyrate dehydrogenase-like beta-hydroxyacid dehydrogenase